MKKNIKDLSINRSVSILHSRVTWHVGSSSASSSNPLRDAAPDPQPLLHATWMPSDPEGKPGWTGIVFVENYTVFYIADVGAKKKRIFPISDVANVVPEVLIHGIPDWIYEGTAYRV